MRGVPIGVLLDPGEPTRWITLSRALSREDWQTLKDEFKRQRRAAVAAFAADIEGLRALSEAASEDWTEAERGITRMVREHSRGAQIGNFILDEDAALAVAAVNLVRALLHTVASEPRPTGGTE